MTDCEIMKLEMEKKSVEAKLRYIKMYIQKWSTINFKDMDRNEVICVDLCMKKCLEDLEKFKF